MADATENEFRPALIVVDMQEDFCPPKGPLAVEGARTIAPLINDLLSRRGFVFKIATQDWHPTTHISFAANRRRSSATPSASYVQMKNPSRTAADDDTIPQRLWPVHCVENSPGAAIIPEIASDKFDLFVHKGMDERVEMYSGFADAFGNEDCLETGGANVNLDQELKSRNVTDVFIVGVAGDYCVKYTAIDAANRDFKAWVVEEGTKCVDSATGWESAKEEMLEYGVTIVQADGPELAKIEV